MTDAELLRAMAQWYRDGRTFTPDLGNSKTCGCFVTAKNSCTNKKTPFIHQLKTLTPLIGSALCFEQELRNAGWTGPECTDDAIAACEIAADLAS